MNKQVENVVMPVSISCRLCSPLGNVNTCDFGGVQVKFEEGIIGAPQVTDSIEVPSSVDVLGQKIDLTPARGLLQPLQEVATRVARTLSGQPPLKFPIQTDRAQSWLLTTFLDEDIRISRGDGGSVFVLLREGSPFLY